MLSTTKEHELESGVRITRYVEVVEEHRTHESDEGLGPGRDKH